MSPCRKTNAAVASDHFICPASFRRVSRCACTHNSPRWRLPKLQHSHENLNDCTGSGSRLSRIPDHRQFRLHIATDDEISLISSLALYMFSHVEKALCWRKCRRRRMICPTDDDGTPFECALRRRRNENSITSLSPIFLFNIVYILFFLFLLLQMYNVISNVLVTVFIIIAKKMSAIWR